MYILILINGRLLYTLLGGWGSCLAILYWMVGACVWLYSTGWLGLVFGYTLLDGWGSLFGYTLLDGWGLCLVTLFVYCFDYLLLMRLFFV